MAAKGITKEQVFEAATALADEGRSPSVQSVRQRLGTGSYSTITTHLRTWNETFGPKAVAHIPEMPDAVTTASQQFWAAAWRAAQEGVGVEREALAAARRELETERAELLREIDELQVNIEASQKDAASWRSQLISKEDIINKVEVERDALKMRNARLEEREKAAREFVEERDATIRRLEERLDALAGARLAGEKSRTK